MDNIIQFPKQKTKVFAIPHGLGEEVDTIQAVNELTCELLCEVIPIYIERGWSLAELDGVVGDFQALLIANAPPIIRRIELDALKDKLRPVWKDILKSVRDPY